MKRIVLIDDDPEFRNMLQEGLTQAGFEIFPACDGVEGLTCIKENMPDLVITDIIMPEKEGVETILEIKALYPDMKYIAISGGGRSKPEGYLTVAKSLGAVETFSKPFKLVDLIKTINSVL